MKVIWLPKAREELRSIVRYLLEEDQVAAVRVGQAIEGQVASLGLFPARGRMGGQPGTRELVIARTPYVVAYRVDNPTDSVVVLRVIPGARRWPQDLGE